MENKNLATARAKKNDEFYTMYGDIEREIAAYIARDPHVFRGKTVLCPCDDPERSNFTKYFIQNFNSLGLKRLISTCYCADGRGKMLLVTGETQTRGTLHGNGDFRSDEITALRDQADMIVTNPPFSVYRDFMAWVIESGKQFLVIGNKNSITYKEILPHILAGRMWTGQTKWSGGMWFETQDLCDVDRVVDGIAMKNVASIWFTNLEHGKRHTPLPLMTMEENRQKSPHKKIRETGYRPYDNYDAIEVPYTDAIPSDYDGVMGVPISFLEKYCPEQFEIVGATESEGKGFSNGLWNARSGVAQPLIGGKRRYKRLFIRLVR